MADDLTADDLSGLADALLRGAGEARDDGYDDVADRLIRAFDLMDDQDWRLTPPPQPGITLLSFTDDQLDALDALLSLVHYDDTALRFLEMLPERLRYSRRVPAPPPQAGTVTELDPREYLAQVPPSGSVTVDADDLRAVLWDGYGGGEPWQEARQRVVAAAGSALAEVSRDH